MEDSHSTPKGVAHIEKLIDRYANLIDDRYSFDGKPVAPDDFYLHGRLTEHLQSANRGALDLSEENRNRVELAHPKIVAEYASACRQIDGAPTSLTFPPAMLSVPDAWVNALPEIEEVKFSTMYMGRAMHLHHWPHLKKVDIGSPVNLKLLSVPTGCVVVADADFPIALDKNFESKDPAGTLVERGFLTIVEYDRPGVPHGARRYRMTEPHWQRSLDSIHRRAENLNGKANDPQSQRPLYCSEIAALWANDRYGYRLSKQRAIAQARKAAPGQVKEAGGGAARLMRFDYANFASVASLLKANQRMSLLHEHYEQFFCSPGQHCVRVSSWPQFALVQFQALSPQPAGAFKIFAMETTCHAMAVEFLVQPGPAGKPMYILSFYDPNFTMLHRRQLAHDLSEVERWRLAQLSADLDDDKVYQPVGVRNPSVILAEYRPPTRRFVDETYFPDAAITQRILKFWPPLGQEPIDSAAQLHLIGYLHFDLWQKLVPKALSPLSETDRAAYLAVPFMHEKRMRSGLASTFRSERRRHQFIRMLDTMSYAPDRIIDMLISVQACGTFNVESVRTPDSFKAVVAAMIDIETVLKPKTLPAEHIVKLLSGAVSPLPGVQAMVHAMAFFDIGAWVEQLKRLLDAKLIGMSEVKHIIASHQPAHKDGWLTLLRAEVANGRPWCARKFDAGLEALKLGVSEAGAVIDAPGGKSGRAGPAAWQLIKEHYTDPLPALQALALTICGPEHPDTTDALFHALRFGKTQVPEVFDAIWELSMHAKDRWKFIGAVLGSIQAVSEQGKRYLFNEIVQAQQGDTVFFEEEPADASQTIDGIVRELAKLKATGMPESLLISLCKAWIDPATPNKTAVNDVLLKRLNLCWADGGVASAPKPDKKNAVAIAPN